MKTSHAVLLGSLVSLLLSGCATIGTSPKGLEMPIEKAAIKFSSDIKEGGYQLVGTEELKKWLDSGKKLTVISTLPARDDKQLGTLPSAVSGTMPKSEKDLTPADKNGILLAAGSDKEQTVVVYCGFVACRRSHLGAKILVENGYKQVYRYPAGIAGWREADFPVNK